MDYLSTCVINSELVQENAAYQPHHSIKESRNNADQDKDICNAFFIWSPKKFHCDHCVA